MNKANHINKYMQKIKMILPKILSPFLQTGEHGKMYLKWGTKMTMNLWLHSETWIRKIPGKGRANEEGYKITKVTPISITATHS